MGLRRIRELLLLEAVLRGVEVVREVLGAADNFEFEVLHLSFDARFHFYVCEMGLRVSHCHTYVY